MPQVNYADRSLNLTVRGTGLISVAFVHGLGPGASVWDLLVQGLPDKYRTLLPDLPGYGESERSGFTGEIDEAATVLHHAFHAFGQISPVGLIGHGYGGLVALSFTARFPSHVRRLILVGAGAFVRNVQELAARHDDVEAHGWDADRAGAWLRAGLAEALADEHFTAMRDATAALDSDLVAGCLRSMIRAQYLEAARTLTVPTLLVRGETDPLVSANELAIFAERAPSAEIKTVASAGHWPHVEAPDELRAVILEFLEGESSTGS